MPTPWASGGGVPTPATQRRDGGTPETNPPGLSRGCGQDGLANGFPGGKLATNPSSTHPVNFGEHPQNFAPSEAFLSGALRRLRDRQRFNLLRGTIEPASGRVHRFRLNGTPAGNRERAQGQPRAQNAYSPTAAKADEPEHWSAQRPKGQGSPSPHSKPSGSAVVPSRASFGGLCLQTFYRQ